MTHLFQQAATRFMLAVAACMLFFWGGDQASAQTIYDTISVVQPSSCSRKRATASAEKEDNSLFFKIEGNTVLMIVAEKQKIAAVLRLRVRHQDQAGNHQPLEPRQALLAQLHQ